MTKRELAQEISNKMKCNPILAEEFIAAFTAIVKTKMIEGNEIFIRGFATFALKRRKAKIARNIKAGTSILLPAHTIPFVRFNDDFKEKIKLND